MGVAILSGVIASLQSPSEPTFDGRAAKWDTHTPGTVTPTIPPEDKSHPSKFIACVGRDNSVKNLKSAFFQLGSLGVAVDIRVRQNVLAVQQADVVILW